MLYQTFIARDPDSKMWVAVIRNRITKVVVTCGVFHWKAEAIRWAEDCIARKAWRTASELPDAFDISLKESV